MKALCDWIARIASALHPSQLEALGNAFISSPAESALTAFRQCAGSSIYSPFYTLGLDVLFATSEVSKIEVASMLQAAAATARVLNSRTDIKLVWTGPTTTFIPVRRTEQVLLELIESAREELFLISYVFFGVASVTSALLQAVARGVKIRALFDRAVEFGGTLKIDDPVNNARRLVPAIEFYSWSAEENGQHQGCMHVKCAIADRFCAFITSANLTAAALEKNMELGIVIKGGQIPLDLNAHFIALVNTRKIIKV